MEYKEYILRIKYILSNGFYCSQRDWLKRQRIKQVLLHSKYRIKESPNALRLNAYKGDEEFIIDTPYKDNVVSITPCKWEKSSTTRFAYVVNIPDTGMVGISEKGLYFLEITDLLRSVVGLVLTPYNCIQTSEKGEVKEIW